MSFIVEGFQDLMLGLCAVGVLTVVARFVWATPKIRPGEYDHWSDAQ